MAGDKVKGKRNPNLKTMTVHTEFSEMVRAIAARRHLTMAEVLDKFAKPMILREYHKAFGEITREGA